MTQIQKQQLVQTATNEMIKLEISQVLDRLLTAQENNIQHHIHAYSEDLEVLTAEASKRGILVGA